MWLLVEPQVVPFMTVNCVNAPCSFSFEMVSYLTDRMLLPSR